MIEKKSRIFRLALILFLIYILIIAPTSLAFQKNKKNSQKNIATLYYLQEKDLEKILKTRTFINGKVKNEKIIKIFGKETLGADIIYGIFSLKNVGKLYVSAYNMYEYDLENDKLIKIGSTPYFRKICDWSFDGQKLLFIHSHFEMLTLYCIGNPPRVQQLRSSSQYNDILLKIWDARFIPGTDNIVSLEEIYVHPSKNRMWGQIMMIDYRINKTNQLVGDYGLFSYLDGDVGELPDFMGELAVSADGKKLAYITNDKGSPGFNGKMLPEMKACILDLENPSKKPIVVAENVHPMSQVSWSSDGKYLVIGYDIYDAKTLKKAGEAGSGINFSSWSPDGNYIAYCNKKRGTVLYLPEMKKNLLDGKVVAVAWKKE